MMNGRISHFSQVASLRRYTITDGSEKGLEVLDCDNGKIRFLLNVSKASDIMQVYHEGQNVSFISKNGFTNREIPFLRRFEGGMLYTCGLDSVGGREEYELHGTLHQIPAHIVRATCDDKGIAVEALIRDTALFGKNLVLKRRITSAIGADCVTLEDTLTNEGFADEDYCLLYHINVGYPMLDEGARVVADVATCEPRTPWSAQNMATVYEMGAPVPNMEETCYFLKLNRPEISLVNEKLGKKLTVSYSNDTLPHFVQWKSMASGDYALGLEPATTELDDRFAYKTIKPSESIVFKTVIAISNQK
ncbi:MAG: aldose 1-epimerase family protein [Clostridia bacterium]|nr:aldose 1-epimerase family protein [Clostridia bacterium]